MDDNIVCIEKKIKYNIRKLFKKKKYEKCLRMIELYGDFKYSLNDVYVDYEIESLLKNILLNIKNINLFKKEIKSNEKEYILFYDGFGFDLRGLALIYIKALTNKNYNIIFITRKESENNIPSIISELKKNSNNKIYFFNHKNIIKDYNLLLNCLSLYYISNVFLYLTPNDILGLLLGYSYEKIAYRFLINLTDHAFWVGTNVFDYIVEFRDYGGCISKYYRLIDEKKIVKVPYYPLINKDIQFMGFPEQTKGKKIVFSGGSLYKTFGDDNKYYKEIIAYILKKHDDTVFVYAGNGNDCELKKLQKNFPNRVFHLPERKDLYQMMKNSYIYISTYPMIGGLMTQFAVAARTVPFTLLYDECGKGVLLEPEKLDIEFTDINLFLSEIDKCLENQDYLECKKQKLEDQIISQSLFDDTVFDLIQNKKTLFEMKYEKLDTTRLRKEYYERFNTREWYNIIWKKKYFIFIKEFGIDWIFALWIKINNR